MNEYEIEESCKPEWLDKECLIFVIDSDNCILNIYKVKPYETYERKAYHYLRDRYPENEILLTAQSPKVMAALKEFKYGQKSFEDRVELLEVLRWANVLDFFVR